MIDKITRITLALFFFCSWELVQEILVIEVVGMAYVWYYYRLITTQEIKVRK